jgi:hypothetical protein
MVSIGNAQLDAEIRIELPRLVANAFAVWQLTVEGSFSIFI